MLITATLLLGACSDDGRELREPGTGGATPRPVPESTTSIDIFAGAELSSFTLRSPAARPGDLLPLRHARAGDNISPELSWINVPADAEELALVMVDLSANSFVHWVMAGIDPATVTVFEGLVPPGAVQTLNDFGELGWGGPAPPVGDDAHSYVFKLFALDRPSGLLSGEVGRTAIAQIEESAIGVAELITFYRQAAALDP